MGENAKNKCTCPSRKTCGHTTVREIQNAWLFECLVLKIIYILGFFFCFFTNTILVNNSQRNNIYLFTLCGLDK